MTRRETLLGVLLAAALLALFLGAVHSCAESMPVDIAEQALEAAEDTSTARRAAHIEDAGTERSEADRLAEIVRAQGEANAALVAALADRAALRRALDAPLRTPAAGGTLPPDVLADSLNATCRRRGACR